MGNSLSSIRSRHSDGMIALRVRSRAFPTRTPFQTPTLLVRQAPSSSTNGTCPLLTPALRSELRRVWKEILVHSYLHDQQDNKDSTVTSPGGCNRKEDA